MIDPQRRTNRVRNLAAVAHHEAGHALAAFKYANREATVLGIELHEHEDGSASGRTLIDHAGMSDREQLAVVLAGKTAEMVFGFADDSEDVTALGDEDDVARAAELLGRLGSFELHPGWQRATVLVRNPKVMRPIRAIATELARMQPDENGMRFMHGTAILTLVPGELQRPRRTNRYPA